MKYTKFKDPNGKFRFSLSSDKGEIILNSESYDSINCYDNGIRSVRDNAPFDFRYEKRKAAKKQYYFVLKSINDVVIGISTTYTSLHERDRYLEEVKRIAPDAPVENMIHCLF